VTQFITAGRRCHLISVLNIYGQKDETLDLEHKEILGLYVGKADEKCMFFLICTFHLWRETLRKKQQSSWSLKTV
jgi:hypothetical protein